MRLLQISGGLARIPVDKGGAIETFIIQTSKWLTLKGHNVTIVDRMYSKYDASQSTIDGTKIVRVRALHINLRVLPAPFSNFSVDLKVGLNLVIFERAWEKFVRREYHTLDLIFCHQSISTLLFLLRNRDFSQKIVYVSHSARREKKSHSLTDKLASLIENAVASRCLKVIVSTEKIKEQLTQARIPPSKIEIIPPSRADTSFFTPNLSIRDREELAKKYGLGTDRIVLFVGRISQIKGVHYLIRAFKKIKDAGIGDVSLLLVGPYEAFGVDTPSSYAKYLFKLIKDLNCDRYVKFTGPVSLEDLRRIYAVSYIFVLPSFGEASPFVISEAMASGKPIIGTRIGSVRSQVIDGWNGYLIEPGDERELSEKLLVLLRSPEDVKRMGDNSRKRAEEKYSWETLAEQILVWARQN